MDSAKELCQKILFAGTRLHSESFDKQLVKHLLSELNDQKNLLNKLEKNGLAPLFYSHVNHHGLQLETCLALALKSLVLRHQAVAKARYQALTELSEAFQAEQVLWLALKGAALAPSLYESVDQRPMRDMDILVPKKDLKKVSTIMRSIAYKLPEQQPSKYMRGTHQLPNAEKNINGFKISVEIHHNAISQDANDSLEFEDIESPIETVQWDALSIPVLPKELMLHQLCRHLEALHPEGNLKLINVLDVVGFAEKNQHKLNWQLIHECYPHILNTLQCLNYITPLTQDMTNIVGINSVGIKENSPINGVGEIMLPLTTIFSVQCGFFERLKLLFLPSDWWLHLYYGVQPNCSLLFVKLVRHPLKLSKWLLNRLISRILES